MPPLQIRVNGVRSALHPTPPPVTRLSLRLGAVALALLVSSCDSTEETFSRVNLRVGQQLDYEVQYTDDGLFNGVEAYEASGRLTERVVSSGQTLEGRTGLTIVEVELVEYGEPDVTFKVTNWYRPTDARLESVAYRFSGDGPGADGLRSASPTASLADRLVNDAQRLGGDDPDCPFNCATTLWEQPRIVLEYPSYIGQSWTHTVSAGRIFTTREVIGNETIKTPAGTFPCVVIRTRPLETGDRSFDSVDWISTVGLVQRRITYRTPVTLDDGSQVESVLTERRDLVSVRR